MTKWVRQSILQPIYGLNRPQETVTGPIYTKAQIRDQIKIARYNRVIESGEQVPWFSRMIEEISAGNYPGLLTVGHEYALSLGILNRVLDRMAPKVYQMERMPVACELETLRLVLSKDADELKLAVPGRRAGDQRQGGAQPVLCNHRFRMPARR